MKAPRGRYIAQIIEASYTRPSGIHIVDRKSMPRKAVVVAIGADSMDHKYRAIKPDAKLGDIIYLKKWEGKPHTGEGKEAHKQGLITIYFGDVLCVEVKL